MSSMSHKPVLDEEVFTRLLAAAYVMQEHSDRMRANVPVSDFTEIVAQIVDCQHFIQSRKLELEAALELVAARLQKVAGGIGAAIGIREGDTVLYKAGSGTAARLVGTSLPLDASLAAQCIRTGKTVRVPFAEGDRQIDHHLVKRLGAQSLLISPVFHEGKVAAAIELFFSEARLLEESAVRACELMAGLAAEAMAQSAEEELKQELAAERASVLMALETLKPQLQRLVQQPEAPAETMLSKKNEADLCRACGHTFAGNETFCGVCGASRSTGKYPGGELQSKWATLWERQLLSGETKELTPSFRKNPPQPVTPLPEEDVTGDWAADLPTTDDEDNIQSLPADFENDDGSSMAEERESLESGETSLVRDWNGLLEPQVQETLVSSALSERLQRLWTERRGDISLVLAMIVVLVAAVWGFYPGRSHNPSASPSAAATPTQGQKRRPKPKAPQLTFLERTLVSLGLADPPPVPTYMGNPEARVWVDLSTALYHCQDSQFFGKTPKGKETTQGDAQQDQFEPALRKPCE
jgi:hypothetical protein